VIVPSGHGYTAAMTGRENDDTYEDQDAEPSLQAPPEGRPDGHDATKDEHGGEDEQSD
jgi:hypothetical protein